MSHFRCNINLQTEGKPYPRTCARCGNGPCANTRQEFWAAFGELTTGRVYAIGITDNKEVVDDWRNMPDVKRLERVEL